MAENLDKNPKTKAGFSPLHAAAQNGHLEVCMQTHHREHIR